MEPAMTEVVRNVILIRNQGWREGHPPEKRYVKFGLPDDVIGAELRTNQQGYSIYFDRKEIRKRNNPTTDGAEQSDNVDLLVQEERVVHTEYFFNAEFKEVAVRFMYTEWKGSVDKSTLPLDFRAPQRP